MAIVLDHTIVPAKDKLASARFFAEIFGLTVKDAGHFAQVQINENLSFWLSPPLTTKLPGSVNPARDGDFSTC